RLAVNVLEGQIRRGCNPIASDDSDDVRVRNGRTGRALATQALDSCGRPGHLHCDSAPITSPTQVNPSGPTAAHQPEPTLPTEGRWPAAPRWGGVRAVSGQGRS